jgi:MarR family transcriptional regulator, organic hydroperoxide resistance regulator
MSTDQLKLPPAPTRVLKKFRVIYGSVRQHYRDIEQSCGVSGSQLWILQEVSQTPGIGVSELAERLSIHQSTCSQLVEKLNMRGLIQKERSHLDQRRVGLLLSHTAQQLLARAPGPASGLLPEALAALSPEQLQQLDAALSGVVEQLQLRDERFADKPLADL